VSRQTAATLLGIHRKTVVELERRGVLVSVRIAENGHPRYRLEDIRRLAQGAGTGPEPAP